MMFMGRVNIFLVRGVLLRVKEIINIEWEIMGVVGLRRGFKE